MPEATGSRSFGLAAGLGCAATVGLESERGMGKRLSLTCVRKPTHLSARATSNNHPAGAMQFLGGEDSFKDRGHGAQLEEAHRDPNAILARVPQVQGVRPSGN